jgi:hypothetical protein
MPRHRQGREKEKIKKSKGKSEERKTESADVSPLPKKDSKLC